VKTFLSSLILFFVTLTLGLSQSWSLSDPAFVRQTTPVLVSSLVFSNSISSYCSSKTFATSNWYLFNGSGGQGSPIIMARNPDCWIYPVDFSGYCAGWWDGSYPGLCLITARHAITAHHVVGNYATPGTLAFFRGNDGVYYTNIVLSTTNVIEDIEVVTFYTNFNSRVVPFMVLSTNYATSLNCNHLNFVWYSYATGYLKTSHVTTFADGSSINFDYNDFAGCPFGAGQVGGTSSHPMWFLLTNRLALAATFWYSTSGPFISYPPYWATIAPILGTNIVEFVNLSTFSRE
jgi:hypothetical protein